MKKEDWIDSIMESAIEIKKVEENPFLYQKLVKRLNQPENDSNPIVKYKLGWAIAIVILVSLNIFAITIYKLKSDNQKKSAIIERLSGEMISNLTYNY